MLHDVTPYVRAATITPTGRSATETVPRSPGGGQTARTPQHRIRQRCGSQHRPVCGSGQPRPARAARRRTRWIGHHHHRRGTCATEQ
jgi:hypothetical protein